MKRRGRPRAAIDQKIRTPEELQAWREARRLTQTELASLLQVHKQTVYRWEANETEITFLAELAMRYLDHPTERESPQPMDIRLSLKAELSTLVVSEEEADEKLEKLQIFLEKNGFKEERFDEYREAV